MMTRKSKKDRCPSVTDQSPSQRDGTAGSHDPADAEPDSTPPSVSPGDKSGDETHTTVSTTVDAPAEPPPAPPPPQGSADESAAPRRTARRAGVAAAIVVAALGVAYGVLYFVAGDSLARGATVAGIDVGGMTPSEAEATLAEQLPGVVDAPVHLTMADGETSFEIVPSEAGLTIDVPATVAAVPGGSANPV